jgi:hypothetical protein
MVPELNGEEQPRVRLYQRSIGPRGTGMMPAGWFGSVRRNDATSFGG